MFAYGAQKPAYAVRFGVSNPLSQVGVRKTAFEVPFWGRDSRDSILVSQETVIGSKQLKP